MILHSPTRGYLSLSSMRGYRHLGQDISQDPSQAAVFQETGIYPDQQNTDITANALAQYTSDQIMQAFQWLQSTYASENQVYSSAVQWYQQNKDTLSPDGQQLYVQGLQTQTDVVNELMQAVSQFAAVLNNLGYSVSAPGLTGWRLRSAALGQWQLAAVIGAIIVIVIGAVAWQALQTKKAQAEAQMAQAQTMTQVQANVPVLMQQCQASGMSYSDCWKQVQAYVQDQRNANQPGVLDKIPWMTLGIGAVVIYGISKVFG